MRMREALSHRGPDGEGLMVDGPVGLAHRRLAIVDVDAGRQPMCNEDGSVFVVHNGEIYNHAQLRPGLEANGHRYRSRCDTETILPTSKRTGRRGRLRSMFALPSGSIIAVCCWHATGWASSALHYAFAEPLILRRSAAVLARAGRPAFNEKCFRVPRHTLLVGRTVLQRDSQLLQALSWSPAEGSARVHICRSRPVGPQHSLKSTGFGIFERQFTAIVSDVRLACFVGGLDSSALAALVAGRSRAGPACGQVSERSAKTQFAPRSESVGAGTASSRPPRVFQRCPTWWAKTNRCLPSSVLSICLLAREREGVLLARAPMNCSSATTGTE